MAQPARKLADWEDILAAPEGMKVEVLSGALEVAPRPLPVHGRVQGAIGSGVGGPFDYDGAGPGGWWILIEPDVSLSPHDIVSPDVAGWRRERLPDFPDSRPILVAPDWVCEVLSPSTSRRDRVEKADLYLRSAVGHYWIIDPAARTLEAWEARDGAWMRLGAWTDGAKVPIAPFDAIDLDVGALFPPLPAAEE